MRDSPAHTGVFKCQILADKHLSSWNRLLISKAYVADMAYLRAIFRLVRTCTGIFYTGFYFLCSNKNLFTCICKKKSRSINTTNQNSKTLYFVCDTDLHYTFWANVAAFMWKNIKLMITRIASALFWPHLQLQIMLPHTKTNTLFFLPSHS